MEVRRLNPEDGFIREFTEYRNRVKSLETKPAGSVVIRETLTTTDPNSGVSTTIGLLPDGSYGLEQFIGDIEPPPVSTAPTVSAQPGVFVVWWDGQFVGNAAKPRDFVHVNVLAYKVVGGVTQPAVEVGVIRIATESIFVSTDVAAVGETWKFSLQSEDYNGNVNSESAFSATVAMESAVSDAGVNEALEGIRDDIILASSKAASAQTAAGNAQNAADLAAAKADAQIASGSSLTVNGDFESLNNLGWPTFSGSTIEASTGTARSGTKVLRSTLSSGSRYAYTDYIAGATNRTYYVEFYVRLREAAVAGTEALSLGALFSLITTSGTSTSAATYGTGYGATPLTMGDLSTTVWKKFSTSYTFTTADVAKVRFGPRIPGSTQLGNTMEIDDFKVIDVTEAALAQTRADQAYSQSVSAASAAGSAQSTADSKNRSWSTTTAPAGTGHTAGDIWYDTANGNRLNLWVLTPTPHWEPFQDAAIKAASNAATGAQKTADGKNTSYYSPSKPTGTFSAGDMWYDTANGYKLYVYVTSPAVNGVSNDFAPFQDSAIGDLKLSVTSVSQTATGALSVANGKNKSYVGSAAPATSGSVVGDIWLDTANGNAIKRYAGSGVWTDYRDTTIAAANNAATAAASIANGKNSSSVGSSAPAASASTVGDLWIDTGNQNAIKRYAGGGVWTDYRDLTIASASNAATAAQASADGKTTTFHGPTQPSTVNRKIGDTWFDTDDDNKIYVWNGTPTPSWTATTFGNNAIADFAVTNAKIANGTIQSAKIGSVDAGSMTLGILAADRIGANTIGVEKLTVGSMDNLISEPTFLNSGNAWVTGGVYTIDPTGARSGGPAFKIANAASQQGKYNLPNWIPIEEGQSYRMMAYVKSDVSVPVSAISLFIGTKNAAGTVTPRRAATNLSVIPANTWTAVAGSYTIPAGALSARFGIYKENNLSTGNTWFDFVSVTRMAGGELIVDGSITAGSAIIAEAAISSAQIISLNASKVSASWIDVSGELKANAIKSSNIAVTDLTNFAPSYAEDSGAWTLTGGLDNVATSVGAYDKRRFAISSNTTGASAQGPMQAVQPTDSLYAEGKIYRTGVTTNKIYLKYQFYDANKVSLSDDGVMFDTAIKGQDSIANSSMVNTSIHRITATVPAGAMYARLCIVITNATANDIGMYNVKGYKRFGGVLLVDGAIVAGSAIIATGAIEDAQIKNLTITSASVAEISADKLKSGFVDTNRLLAGSIGADKIVVGVGYNLAYNGSAQQTGAAVGGTTDPNAPTRGYSGFLRSTSNPPTGFASFWTTTAGQGTTTFLNDPTIPVKPNTNYRVNVWVKADVAGSKTYLEPLSGSTAAGHRIMNPYPDANGTYTQMVYAFSNVDVPTVWTPWTVEFRTGTAPAQTMSFRWFVNHTNGTTTTSVFSFTGFEFIEMTAGELLVNGAIKTQHMTAGSIDGGVITAATIKALQIGSKEISVDKLLVTSTDNMVQEADFTGLGKGWYLATDATPTAGWSVSAATGRNGGPALQVANAASLQESWNSTITGVNTAGAAIKTRLLTSAAGKQTYRVSAWVKSTVAVPVSGIKIVTRYTSSTGAVTFGGVTYVTPGTQTPATIAANTWTEISGQVTTPDDNVNIAFGVQSNTTLATGTLYFDFVSATRASDGQLIVDGAIKTQHMIAGTIDGGIISVNSLSGASIVGKSIQADRLVISSTDNLVVESDFTNNGSSWGTLNANKLIVATAGRGTGPALRVTGSTSLQVVNNLVNKVPVGTEDRFRGSFYVKSSAAAVAGAYKLRIRPWTSTSTTGSQLTVASSPALIAGAWTLVEGYSPTLPTNTIAVEFFLEATNAATGTTTDFDYVAMTRAADGKLVVDGAIDGKTITGASFLTSADPAASGGLIFDKNGLRAYNPVGAQTFAISAITGNVTSTGTFATKTEQVSGVAGGGTMTIGATFGNFTYNTSTDFSGIPGIEFSRVHSTQGIKDPARIFYDGKSINITTIKDVNAFVPSYAAASGVVGEGLITFTSFRNSTTQAASELVPQATLQLSTELANPGLEAASMQLDYKLSSYWRRSGVRVDVATGGNAYAGAGRYATGIVHENLGNIAGQRGKSQMVVNDNGIWTITGQRNSDGGFVTMVNSQSDASGVSTGVLGLFGINKVAIGNSFADSGLIEVVPATTTINNALSVQGNSTFAGSATFNSDFVVGNTGVTTLPASTTIGGTAANWSAITPTTVAYSAGYQGYSGFATPVYYRDSVRVTLAGVIGTTVATIALAAGNTYTVGVLPAAYRPSQDILFSPLVGATMSSNIVFYVRANGNLQYYSPTTQSLAQSAFYLGLDGMSWLRTQ